MARAIVDPPPGPPPDAQAETAVSHVMAPMIEVPPRPGQASRETAGIEIGITGDTAGTRDGSHRGTADIRDRHQRCMAGTQAVVRPPTVMYRIDSPRPVTAPACLPHR